MTADFLTETMGTRKRGNVNKLWTIADNGASPVVH